MLMAGLQDYNFQVLKHIIVNQILMNDPKKSYLIH